MDESIVPHCGHHNVKQFINKNRGNLDTMCGCCAVLTNFGGTFKYTVLWTYPQRTTPLCSHVVTALHNPEHNNKQQVIFLDNIFASCCMTWLLISLQTRIARNSTDGFRITDQMTLSCLWGRATNVQWKLWATILL